MNNKYTSLELSKKLNGCDLESEVGYLRQSIVKNNKVVFTDKSDGFCGIKNFNKEAIYPAYDILWDICIKYAFEFFGDEVVCKHCEGNKFSSYVRENNVKICRGCFSDTKGNPKYQKHIQKIFSMLQQNKPQKKIEKYIWENCLYSKNNDCKNYSFDTRHCVCNRKEELCSAKKYYNEIMKDNCLFNPKNKEKK